MRALYVLLVVVTCGCVLQLQQRFSPSAGSKEGKHAVVVHTDPCHVIAGCLVGQVQLAPGQGAPAKTQTLASSPLPVPHEVGPTLTASAHPTESGLLVNPASKVPARFLKV